MADPASKLVSERISIVHNGKMLAFMSDCFALWIVALTIAVVSFVLSPEKSLLALLGWICYSLCISCLCLLISGFGTFGRIDILAPFLAIASSVVGGCFTDLSLLSGAFRVIARCTPQGQLFAVINGNGLYCFALLAESALALTFTYLIRRKHSV